MSLSQEKNEIIVEITDPDTDLELFVECGWAPGEVSIINATSSDIPELKWNQKFSGSMAEGLVLDKASSLTKAKLAAGAGVSRYAGGGQIYYNSAVIGSVTYQDEDGTSFTGKIYDADGNDILARDLPGTTSGSDNGASHTRKEGLKLAANIANLRVSDSDKLVITIKKL